MAVTLSLSITQNSQNVANNTSNVTVTATIHWTNGSWNAYAQCHGSITIDGVVHEFTEKIRFNESHTQTGSQVVMTKTVNVSHNSDGTKSLNCSSIFYVYLSSTTSVSASASKTLTTIPRKSTLSVANGTLGTAQTLTITEQASSFVHKLTYSCGSASGYILGSSSATSATLSTNWTPPLSLAQQNTTGASVSVTFTLYTYSGSTLVGSNTYTKTFSIPSSEKPSVSVAVSDPMGYAGTYGAYVQGLSKLNIAITASGSQGSTIKSYKTEADGKTYTASGTITTGVVAGTGTLTIKVTVTDSRGRTATASTTISVLAYEPPKISALSAYRCDANGNASSSGVYLAVKFSATITSLNSKNTAAYTIKYKKSSATSYTTKTLSDFAGKYSVSNGIYVFSAETASSYDITLTVNDAFKSVVKNAAGSSEKKLWSLLKKAGEIVGIAIGKIAELEGVLDVDMVIRARKGIVDDSPWVDMTLDDAFAVYDGNVSNHPKYKVSGNVVTITGSVSPKTEYTSSLNKVNIASGIPSAYLPKTNQSFVCQGSGMNHWNCIVTTGGYLTVSRYGITEPTTVPTSAWLVFTVTYQI